VTTRGRLQTLGDIRRAKRMRALREVLDDEDDPHHAHLVALADLLIDDEEYATRQPAQGDLHHDPA